jgi:PAS domain S-box-containing protein
MNDLDDASASLPTTTYGDTLLGEAGSPPQTLALARAAQRQLADLARQADQTRGTVLRIFSSIEAHRQAGVPTTFDVAVELDDTTDRLLDLMGRIHDASDPYTAWASATDDEPAAQPPAESPGIVVSVDVEGLEGVEHFAMVTSATDAVIGVDAHGRIVSWNSEAERLYGWSRSDALGRPISLIASDEAAADVVARCRRVLEGEKVRPFVGVRRHRDGTAVEVRITPTAVFTSDGTVVAAVAVHCPNRRQTDVDAG